MQDRIQNNMLFIKSMKPHYHKDLLEIILVVSGEVDVYKAERKVTLKKGEFTFVNRNVVHYLQSEGAHIISCKIKLADFKYIYDKIEYVEFMAQGEIQKVDRPLSSKLNAILVDNIIRLFYLRNQRYLLDEVDFYENQIMYSLYRDYQLISHAKNDIQTNDDVQDRYYFVVEYVMKNMSKKILTQDIVGQLYMNPTYFSQFMKKVGGTGFKEFVLYRKLLYILTYLIEDQYSMNEIASFVGITDMKSFYNIFKKAFHVSPAKWKNKVSLIKDDFECYIDKDILDTFILEFNIHKHKDNTISKVFKELTVYKERGYSLKGANITINPYEDMGKHIDPDYQLHKCMDSLVKLVREIDGTITLKYPYCYLKDQKQYDLVLKTIDWMENKNILRTLKDGSIIIFSDSFYDLEEMIKLRKNIRKACHHLDIELCIEGVEMV